MNCTDALVKSGADVNGFLRIGNTTPFTNGSKVKCVKKYFKPGAVVNTSTHLKLSSNQCGKNVQHCIKLFQAARQIFGKILY